jgi:hypothetical protein
MVGARKESEKSIAQGRPAVEKVPLSSLRRVRQGKHYLLMQQVLEGLAELSNESALKVPLGSFSAKDLRSAVSRAASSHNIRISSTSDRDNLYIWKRR